MAWSLAQIFGLEGRAGPRHLALRGRRLRQQDAVAAIQVLAAAASKLAGRPVRIMLSREGVYRVVGGRTLHRAARGDRRAGRRPLRRAHPHRLGGDDGAQQHARALHPAGAQRLRSGRQFQARRGSRHAGHAGQHLHARAGRIGGHLRPGERRRRTGCRKLGMDPIELRIRNEPEKDPTSGMPFSSRHIVEAWRSGAERFGWSQRRAEPGTQRDGEWLVGMGCATATYPYYRMPGGAARITLTRDGHARRRDRRARDGHGHGDRADAGRRRATRPADGAGDSSATATRRFPAWCSPAARSRRPRSAAP